MTLPQPMGGGARDLPPALPDDNLRQILDLLARRFGFQFRDSALEMARTRLRRRLVEIDLADLRDYYFRLLYDPDADAELDTLFDALANNETYFFRQDSQIWALAEEVLPARLGDGARVRIWSAGCSTGEEPYSLAMAILERHGSPGPPVEIFASDLSRRALARAREGMYTSFAFRNTPDEVRRRYFMPAGEGRFRISPEVRRMVQFGRCNLVGTGGDLPLVRFDAIFCRNVLIYFDREARRQVVDLFYDRLADGGYLFLGHSESLLDLSDRFGFADLKRDTAYRRETG